MGNKPVNMEPLTDQQKTEYANKLFEFINGELATKLTTLEILTAVRDIIEGNMPFSDTTRLVADAMRNLIADGKLDFIGAEA